MKRISSSFWIDSSSRPTRARSSAKASAFRTLCAILMLMNQKHPLFILVLDFSKAYDRCNHLILFRKMLKKGIKGNLWTTIVDMYKDSTASFFVNGILSKPFPVTTGVAQGCSLSPLLFLIYLQWISK